MAIDLAALAAKSADITVDFMGQSAAVSYKPDLLTSEKIAAAQKGGDQEFLAYFAELITAWDVKRGTKKVPLTIAGLNSVPFPLVRTIFKAIYQGSGADVEEGNSSSAG